MDYPPPPCRLQNGVALSDSHDWNQKKFGEIRKILVSFQQLLIHDLLKFVI